MADTLPVLYLAPMAGVADSAFRRLCKRGGADVTVSEMISAKAVCFGDKKTFSLAGFDPAERPFWLQIFGSEPRLMAQAAQELCQRFSPDGLDINMGCPVGKIVKNKEGSALMSDPGLVYEITARVREAVEVPVSVKIRAGRTPASRNAVEVALAAQKAGASAVTVHGKTASQLYAPPVDRQIIAQVKEALGKDFLVIANGEITDGPSAKQMMEQTGCHHLMIGRAALGRPWIFDEIRAYLEGRPFTPPQDLRHWIGLHLRWCCENKGEEIAVREMRKHVAAYLKGFPGAPALRDTVNRAITLEEMQRIVERIMPPFLEEKGAPKD